MGFSNQQKKWAAITKPQLHSNLYSQILRKKYWTRMNCAGYLQTHDIWTGRSWYLRKGIFAGNTWAAGQLPTLSPHWSQDHAWKKKSMKNTSSPNQWQIIFRKKFLEGKQLTGKRSRGWWAAPEEHNERAARADLHRPPSSTPAIYENPSYISFISATEKL